MKIGIIGLGYWGPHYVRIFKAMGHDVFVCDSNEERIKPYLSQCPVYLDVDNLIRDVNAVVIATPTTTHYDLAQKALFRGKHVLCEKPVTLKPMEHWHLTNCAKENNLVLFPGLTFLFNQYVRHIKAQYFDKKIMGECLYVRTERVNYGPVRHDVDAIADLATHDVSILSYLLGKPKYVNHGLIKKPGQSQAGAGYLNLNFNGVQTSSFVSWNEPVKSRTIRMVFENGAVDFDDLLDKPVSEYSQNNLIDQPFFENKTQPLDNMANEFIDCIESIDCEFGLRNLQQISEYVTDILSVC